MQFNDRKYCYTVGNHLPNSRTLSTLQNTSLVYLSLYGIFKVYPWAHASASPFFPRLNSTLLHTFTNTVCLHNCPLVDAQVVSTIRWPWTALLWTWIYKVLSPCSQWWDKLLMSGRCRAWGSGKVGDLLQLVSEPGLLESEVSVRPHATNRIKTGTCPFPPLPPQFFIS